MSTSTDIIDAHVHLSMPGDSSEPIGSVEDLVMQMDMTSVDAAVILPNPLPKGMNPEKYNEFIADTVKQYPQFVGFGSVNPLDGAKALKELDRFPSLHLKGLKLNPLLQNFNCDTKEMEKIAQKCNDMDIPILIHSYFPFNTQESERLYRLVQNHEETVFILAHTGGHTFVDFFSYVERRKTGKDNVYFDVSSISIMFRRSPYTEQLTWLLQQMGADRVIFGSNYPKYQLVDALAAFDELSLSFSESQHIMGKTITHLLNL
ncbi:MAG: amidohydrolase family protein [Theionarchaea archaeon]|nr:amidohydrolase family protein [Theionarchaea archaeon]